MHSNSSLLPKTPKVFRIEDRDKLQVHVTKILIDESVHNLKEVGESFISNISKREAYLAKKSMMRRLKDEDVTIKYYEASAEDPSTKTVDEGFLFRMFRNS